jgi:hypothetical protein
MLKVLTIALAIAMAASAFGQPHDDSVTDLNAKWHFSWVADPYDDLYSDGKNTLLCVRTSTGQYALWDPDRDTLAVRLTHKCKPNGTLHRIRPQIAHGVQIGGTSFPGASCSELFNSYNTVRFPNRHEGAFYIFGKLASPKQESEYSCDPKRAGGANFSQAYGEVVAKEMTLRDGSVLFVADSYAQSGMCFACRDTFKQPTLLRMKDVPDSVQPLGGDTLVVPQPLLETGLDDGNENNAARYRAVMDAIGEHPLN